jgi:small subunit ribosomal protein S7
MRRRKAVGRETTPDAVYNDILVSKMINRIMWSGKKTVAQKIVYSAFDIIKDKTKQDPLEVYHKAVNNVSPIVEVKPRRVGGATYQVPVEVQEPRKTTLALRWIISASRAKKGKPMAERLAMEIIDAFNNTGVSIKKKEDVHRMAEANRAFAHFKW